MENSTKRAWVIYVGGVLLVVLLFFVFRYWFSAVGHKEGVVNLFSVMSALVWGIAVCGVLARIFVKKQKNIFKLLAIALVVSVVFVFVGIYLSFSVPAMVLAPGVGVLSIVTMPVRK